MTGTELMARIAALVPLYLLQTWPARLRRLAILHPTAFRRRGPPRYPLTRYHGCFAPTHVWRRSVVPKPPLPRASCTPAVEPAE